jgi:hypothetical protein
MRNNNRQRARDRCFSPEIQTPARHGNKQQADEKNVRWTKITSGGRKVPRTPHLYATAMQFFSGPGGYVSKGTLSYCPPVCDLSRPRPLESSRIETTGRSQSLCGSGTTGEIRVALVRGMETAGRLTTIWIHSPTAMKHATSSTPCHDFKERPPAPTTGDPRKTPEGCQHFS